MDSGEHDRWQAADRRGTYGALMLAAFATARRPLSFRDLASVVAPQGATISDVADWLATARQSGMIADRGFDSDDEGNMVGPRLFALADSARAVIRIDHRRSIRGSGAA